MKTVEAILHNRTEFMAITIAQLKKSLAICRALARGGRYELMLSENSEAPSFGSVPADMGKDDKLFLVLPVDVNPEVTVKATVGEAKAEAQKLGVDVDVDVDVVVGNNEASGKERLFLEVQEKPTKKEIENGRRLAAARALLEHGGVVLTSKDGDTYRSVEDVKRDDPKEVMIFSMYGTTLADVQSMAVGHLRNISYRITGSKVVAVKMMSSSL